MCSRVVLKLHQYPARTEDPREKDAILRLEDQLDTLKRYTHTFSFHMYDPDVQV